MVATLARLVAAICVATPSAALGAKSDWSLADQSRLRLLVGDMSDDGRISGGIELQIEPGWHTYWRNPGEAGLAPTFDFSGSENVADVTVAYPVPERYDDGTSTSLIYRDEAVFPLTITPADPSSPTVVRLAARFGVCSIVCIPTTVESAVSLPSVPDADPATEARLRLAAARLPEPPDPGRFDIERLTVEGDDLLIDVRSPASSYRDLFAEPPADWFTGQPRPVLRDGTLSRYRMSLVGRPEGHAIAGQRFHFVAVAGSEAIEKVVTLP
jgi:DsbC/DsbD-like thiol-disulfide interchange protein